MLILNWLCWCGLKVGLVHPIVHEEILHGRTEYRDLRILLPLGLHILNVLMFVQTCLSFGITNIDRLMKISAPVQFYSMSGPK